MGVHEVLKEITREVASHRVMSTSVGKLGRAELLKFKIGMEAAIQYLKTDASVDNCCMYLAEGLEDLIVKAAWPLFKENN